MADFGTQRHNMVESQVRPSDVTDRRLMRAMQDLPREAFVPAWNRAVAYADEDIQVDRGVAGRPGRALLAARTLAKLLQAADVGPNHRVLDVGCATGYSTALLARLAGEVIGLESDPALVAAARETLMAIKATTAKAEHGPLAQGWPAAAPYDVIVLNGAVPEVPPSLLSQLRDGGRLVGIVAPAGRFGTAQMVVRQGATFSIRNLFDAGGPPLPNFETVAGFTF